MADEMLRVAGRGKDGTAKALQTNDEGQARVQLSNSKTVIKSVFDIRTDASGNAILLTANEMDVTEFKKIIISLRLYPNREPYTLSLYEHSTNGQIGTDYTNLMGKVVLTEDEYELGKTFEVDLNSVGRDFSLRFESAAISQNSVNTLKIIGVR